MLRQLLLWHSEDRIVVPMTSLPLKYPTNSFRHNEVRASRDVTRFRGSAALGRHTVFRDSHEAVAASTSVVLKGQTHNLPTGIDTSSYERI